MYLAILIKLWREVGIGVLFIALVATAALYHDRGITIDRTKEQNKLQLVSAKADYEARARQIEKENYQNVIDAINAAKVREQVIAVDVASANDANDRLHSTIDRLAANATADAGYRVEYTNSVSELFKSCTSVYLELAAKADGHVNDIRLLQESRRK